MNSWVNGTFTVTCDPARLDRAVIAAFLGSSYGAKGIPAATVEKSLAHSLCFALLDGDRLVGFARVISDHATIAYLGDVFLLPEYRGRGLSKWLMECIISHPELQGLRRFMLATKDAHGLYEKLGFGPLSQPEMFLEILQSDPYQRSET